MCDYSIKEQQNGKRLRHYFTVLKQRKETKATLIQNKVRIESVLTEAAARSQFECVTLCKVDPLCEEANFRKATGNMPGLCRFFSTKSNETDLSDDAQWVYLATD